MSSIQVTREKVQRIYTQKLGSVRVGSDNEFLIQHGSANLFVSVLEGFGDEGTIIKMVVPLIRSVPLSADLFRFAATEGQDYLIGSVAVHINGDGKSAWIGFQYCLIGDDLDESELMHATGALVVTADNLDNELHEKFGGELFGRE